MASVPALPASFQKTCIYEKRAPAREILHDLATIRSMGEGLASSRRKWGWFAVLALVSGFLLLVAGIGVLFLIFGIFAFFRWRNLKKKCFDARQHDFVEKALRLLGTDMAPDAPVDVRLDMRPHNLPEKMTDAGKAGEWDVKHYASPWLSLGGKLMDGTGFRLNLNTLFQDRRKKKRSASGKTKFKTRTKQALRAKLQLSPKPEKYPRLEEIGRTAMPALRLPAGASVRRFTAAADSLMLEAGTGEWHASAQAPAAGSVSAPDLAGMMFLSLYQILNLSREAARGQQGGTQA